MTTTEGRTSRPVAKIAADELADVTLTVNGTEATVSVPPRMHLADVLRERLGLTGTHLGCEHGVCGMCTVLVDGDAARACLLFAVQCDGADVVTVEGLGSADDQHPLQRAFSHHHGLQCGFCTPGMLMSGYDLLTHDPAVDADDLPEQMSGVLCRCTGYRGILAAVSDVAGEYPDGVPAPRNCGPRTLVGRSGSPRAGAAPSGEPAPGPAVPDEVRMPTGEPSATVAVRSALASGVDDVWRVLDDIGLLVRCLPGAELVESLDEWRHRGRATVALGPVKLRFDGLAQIVERDPDARTLRVLAQGADAGGSATRAVIALRVEPVGDGGSTLVADADLYLSGRIAQFGRALAGDVSRRLFADFGRSVDEAARTGSAPAAASGGQLRVALGATADALRAMARRVRARLLSCRTR
ncbi:xanthine dehydrogenase family Fe-S subunit [Pseudonocardia endophytica]|uniref:Carbon-monoxide dehydrogenase small subunit n=1 Tax=Pseudonocardia endophytica TaxID=401976 RepID=A0A4R1HZD5_PSEEN|nr:2Fe-2S iron-sulfur cluster-binding protein [Pseudonocardia endophytica]TCK22972.1 carbon-monoxide dehydrogenase small subunit [Pseudonocardia endophytica]